ncbi:protein kinase domain-containing protein [Haliangium sp.]|uniref:serine/threonine-protein kinase n=1 Tax=Haliangium sp. TaxID=2663208 RepID=UPI003D09A4AD
MGTDTHDVGTRTRPETLPPDALGVGDCVGRYTIQERLGVGGMGAVYKAHDPELDRRIALKILRVSRKRGRALEAAKARLDREAQALAQLSHPNVITVYDVGRYGEHVFVAMEFVEGQTLGEWLDSSRPTLGEIVDVFLAAGQGLLAAHGAGLVHRDIKPDNIVVGSDGRVRVRDFGLARATGSDESRSRSASSETGPARSRVAAGGRFAAGSGPSLFDDHASDDGSPCARGGVVTASAPSERDAIAGTPAYMAPEQFLGRAVDARTDQFSFCVTLYWALYGQRPFAGERAADIAANVIGGRISPPPRDPRVRVPGWLRAILLRGLSRAPASRYPGMAELLAELRRGLERRLRVQMGLWAALGAVGLIAIGGGALYAFHRIDDGRARCERERVHAAQVWNDEVEDAVLAAFLATGRPHAGTSVSHVSALFDDYVSRWTSARVEACEATHVRGEQSESLLDLRMSCLDDRMRWLGALARVFARTSDAAVVDRAVDAAYALPELDPCADEGRLLEVHPPPQDPEQRRQVEEVGALLDEAAARLQAGQARAVVDLVADLRQRAGALAHSPLEAKASYLHGLVQDALGDRVAAEASLTAAARQAAVAEDDWLGARAWIALIRILGLGAGRFDHALTLRPVAETAIARAGDPSHLRLELLTDVGAILAEQGRLEEAREALDQSLALVHERHGQSHRALFRPTEWAALVARRQGRLSDAEALSRQVIDLVEGHYGPQHVRMIDALVDLGQVYDERTRGQQARERYRAAAALVHANYGRRSREAVRVGALLGGSLVGEAHYREAAAELEPLLSLSATLDGPHDDEEALVLHLLAEAHLGGGRLDEALVLAGQAVDMRGSVDDDDRVSLADALVMLARVRARRGSFDGAMAAAERALDEYERALGPEHPTTAAALLALGEALSGVGRHDEALVRLGRARALLAARLGPEHRRLGPVLAALGAAQRVSGNAAAAVETYRNALAIAERIYGDAHPELARVLTGLGLSRFEAGGADAAVVSLERALQIWEQLGAVAPAAVVASPPATPAAPATAVEPAPAPALEGTPGALDPVPPAITRFALARALAGRRSQRARARALAEQALVGFSAAGARAQAERDQAEAWLAGAGRR